MSKTKKLILQYTITFLVELILFTIFILLKGIINVQTFEEGLLIVCDGLFVIGAIFTGVGALILISNGGFFDILGFGIKSLGVLFTPKKLKNVEKYYEYHERKQSARENKSSLLFVFVDGMIFVVLAFLCFVI